MITCDLKQEVLTLDEVLRLASADTVRLIRGNGQQFVIAEADAFELEVAQLSSSKAFMRFLAERSQKRRGRSLEAIEQDLATEGL